MKLWRFNIKTKSQPTHTPPASAEITEFAPRSNPNDAVVLYAVAIALTIAILYKLMALGAADLSIPFIIWSDSRLYRALFKGMIENGWYVFNPSLGAPFGMDMHDWVPSDYGNFLLSKLISLCFPSPETTFNIYYLLSFPLTTVTALFTLRRLGFSVAPSLLGSILYTFLPYHFLRVDHLFLSCYCLVPLLVLTAIWVAQGVPLLVSRDPESGKLRPSIRDKSSLLSLGILALAAASGVYYVFFACFFLVIAGIQAFILRRELLPTLRAVILSGAATLILLLCMSPTILYRFHYGPNPEAVVRSPHSAEEYGLKIAQLVLPMRLHRIPRLANLRRNYDHGPLNNENSNSSLGAAGTLGFLALIALAFFPFRGSPHWQLVRTLATLNIAALLLATIGGFGSILSWLGLKEIRAYNRISIFIALFSVLALVSFFETAINWAKNEAWRRAAIIALLLFVFVAGLWEQTSPLLRPSYAAYSEHYSIDAEFVSMIEALLPERAMIFQLPHISFPEGGAPGRMIGHDHFEAYLHSRSLRWSFGAIKGREGGRWQDRIASLSPEEMVSSLAFYGFSGIYVDRSGYQEDDKIAEELARIIGSKPLVSRDERLVFFDIRDYPKKATVR